MNYIKINTCDIVNTISGVALSLWVSGCRNACEGCFNRESWDFNIGQKFTEETMSFIISSIKENNIKTFSVLGGEPFDDKNRKHVLNIIARIRMIFPTIKIIVWTGYFIESISESLNDIDYVIDGKFEKNNPTKKKLRGSDNQRLLHNVNGRWAIVL